MIPEAAHASSISSRSSGKSDISDWIKNNILKLHKLFCLGLRLKLAFFFFFLAIEARCRGREEHLRLKGSSKSKGKKD